MHYMKRPREPDQPRLLPIDYVAGPHVVMIGRGRRCLNNEGNRRFRAMVKAELQEYSAGRKAKKSSIIKRILREIRDNCFDGVGFIKQDASTGRYYTATTTAAKVTVAQAFRDALNDTKGYKSSKQYKQFKRDIARGKINPEDVLTKANELGVCTACREDLQPATEGMTVKTLDDATPTTHYYGSEPLLNFWKDHVVQSEKVNDGVEPEATKTARAQFAIRGEAFPIVLEKKDVDPFEPIPLDMDVKNLALPRPGIWGKPLFEHEQLDHSEDSINTSPSHDETTDDDDDDEHAIVAWASEFVHCPLCSLVQGRGDLKELPIQDIRKALIG